MTYRPPPRPSRQPFTILYRDGEGHVRERTINTTGEASARLAVMRDEDVPASSIINVTTGGHHGQGRF